MIIKEADGVDGETSQGIKVVCVCVGGVRLLVEILFVYYIYL